MVVWKLYRYPTSEETKIYTLRYLPTLLFNMNLNQYGTIANRTGGI